MSVHQLSSLPDTIVHPHVQAFRTIESILKNDHLLKRVIRTWRSWEGKPDDRTPLTSSNAPFCRLTPRPSPAQWINESRHLEPLLIQLEIGILGTRWDNGANIWRAFECALFPQNDAESAASIMGRLVKCGVQGGVISITQPAIDLKLDSTDEPILNVIGQLKLLVMVNT
jgi:hypothetical protein